jgi:hypothetical protein
MINNSHSLIDNSIIYINNSLVMIDNSLIYINNSLTSYNIFLHPSAFLNLKPQTPSPSSFLP